MMFRRRRNGAAAEADDGREAGPFDERRASERLAPLRRQTGMTDDQFDASYGVLFDRAWSGIAAGRGAGWDALRGEILRFSEAVLIVAKGHRLPRFVDADDQAHMAQLMKFALVAAVVVERVWMHLADEASASWRRWADLAGAGQWPKTPNQRGEIGVVLLGTLLDDECSRWIGKHEPVVRELLAYVSARRGDFRPIVDKAAQDTGIVVPMVAEEERRAEPGEGKATGTLIARGEEKAPEEAASRESEDARGAPEETDGAAKPVEEPPPRIGGSAAGWRWVNFVRKGLWSGEIATSGAEAWIFHVAGRTFVAESGIRWYADKNKVAAKQMRNRILSLGIHVTRSRDGKKYPGHMVEFSEDGRQVRGYLFENRYFWDDRDPPRPPEGAELRRDWRG